jgi:flagella basal body P-ring formation protein FlgA
MAWLLALMTAWGTCAPVRAAELRLKTECRPAGSLVLLGDVAEIHAASDEQAQALAAIELFPAPPPGRRRFLHARELQDLLDLRGLNRLDHRLSGSSTAEVRAWGPEPQAPAAAAPQRLALNDRPSPLAVRQADQAVRQAILTWLDRSVPGHEPWEVAVALTEEQVKLIGAAEPLVKSGGSAPWLGPQQFIVAAGPAPEAPELPLEAEITAAATVVVAVRGLPLGTLVQQEDLQVVPQNGRDAPRAIRNPADAVGRETTRAVPAGQPLSEDGLRAPILVRRGETVTVYARSSGVEVRTTARAQQPGALGDVIPVESLLNRQRYFARVTGIQEVLATAGGDAAPGKGAATASMIREAGR